MEATIIDRGRGPEIAGTRISVFDVYHYLESGEWPETEIADILGLSADQIKAAIRYIDEHKAEVQKIHLQIEERIACGNSPEIEAKLVESRKKREEFLQHARQLNNREKNGVGDPSRR